MKFIPIGLQCAVPDAIKASGLREYSYPFDWLWTPSKTTYEILYILLNNGVDETVEYMTSDFSYFKYLGNEKYSSVDNITMEQLNKTTGLGITHFEINDQYKEKLRRRLQRLLTDIHSDNRLVLIYADSSDKEHEYIIDGVIYSREPMENLLKIYDLIHEKNNNIELLYFCWDERVGASEKITYIPFDTIRDWYIRDWNGVSILIQQYFGRNKDKYYL
jgi:hypothetical protein